MRWQPPNPAGIIIGIFVGCCAARKIVPAAWQLPDALHDRWWLADQGILPSIGIALVVIVLVSYVGFLFALLPMIVGVSIMGCLGGLSRMLRSPIIWAAAGFAMMYGINQLLGDDHDMPVKRPLLVTATLCALLARRYVRWPDKEESV
jgi:hypothetical protein